MTFRYTVEPLENKTTNLFRPKDAPPDADSAAVNMKAQSLGSVFGGSFNKVIANKRASLVWEAEKFWLSNIKT